MHSRASIHTCWMALLAHIAASRHWPAQTTELILTSLSSGAASQDCTARVWDMEIGDCVLVMEGHTGPLTNAALAGQVLLTSSQDCTVRVWDMEHGKCLHVLSGHTAAVNDVAVTRDGKLGISVSSDETARIWNLTTGKCQHTMPGRLSGKRKALAMTHKVTLCKCKALIPSYTCACRCKCHLMIIMLYSPFELTCAQHR